MPEPAEILAYLETVRAGTLSRFEALTQEQLDWLPPVVPSDNGESSWSLGEGTSLLDTPKSALLAFSSRSSISSRETSSKELVDLVSATFPNDLGEPEKKALAGFFSGWDKARGDRANGALLYGGPKQVGLVMRVLANNPGEVVKLLKCGCTLGSKFPYNKKNPNKY